MTEDEAKTKLCCVNRELFCIAFECLAWRWLWNLWNDPFKPAFHPSTGGYCGLAGKP